MWDYIGEDDKVAKGDTRTSDYDYSSCSAPTFGL